MAFNNLYPVLPPPGGPQYTGPMPMGPMFAPMPMAGPMPGPLVQPIPLGPLMPPGAPPVGVIYGK